MKKILTWWLIALQVAATQVSFAEKKTTNIIDTWKSAIILNLKDKSSSNPTTDWIVVKPKIKKIKIPRKKLENKEKLTNIQKTSTEFIKNGETLVVPIEFVEKWEDVIVPIESVENGKWVQTSVESVKKGEKVIVPKESVKEHEMVTVSIESVKKGKRVVVPIEAVKKGAQVMVYVESVKKWQQVTVPVEYVKKWENITVLKEVVKKGEDIIAPKDSIKHWEKVIVPSELVKKWKQVWIPVKSLELSPEIIMKNKKIKEYSQYKNVKEIYDFIEKYKSNIESRYADDKVFFRSFFVDIINNEKINERFLDLLKSITTIEDKQIEYLDKIVKKKFGEKIYEKIYSYLFYISLNQIWEKDNNLYNYNNKNAGYYVLNSETFAKFVTKGFTIFSDESIGEAITLQKKNNIIEIVSMEWNQMIVIWELDTTTINNLENTFYCVLDFILNNIEKLPATPLKEIWQEGTNALDSSKNSDILNSEKAKK